MALSIGQQVAVSTAIVGTMGAIGYGVGTGVDARRVDTVDRVVFGVGAVTGTTVAAGIGAATAMETRAGAPAASKAAARAGGITGALAGIALYGALGAASHMATNR